ncbi:MAG: translation initiation factor IF-2 subunit alpha [Methanobacteriota archaeon]|nr:MAG: translation initiation factor IF-2 subunit alpha [Euryarchaeota archaeon]
MLRTSEYPEVGDLVVCSVKNVKNFGAFVSLDEFGDKEGFIHIAEVARGWIKYIRDYVREGQKVVCKVLNVDPSKGHVDLSLKQVNEHQRREKIQEWKNEQKAEKLLEMVAEKEGSKLEAFYEKHGQKLIDKFGSLYGAFEEASIEENALKDEGFKGKWVEHFVQAAKENIALPEVSIDAFVEMTCPVPDGVDHIREALSIAQTSGDAEVTVQYIGAPRYRLVVTAPDYKTAEEEILAASERAIEYITSRGGKGKFQRKE